MRKTLNPRSARPVAAADLRRECEYLRVRVAVQAAALRQAAREAEILDYSIAHDLRTPLRAVSSTANILLEELGPDLGPNHRSLLLRQSHNAKRYGCLIDDLLEYSRLARVEIRRQTVDVTRLVQEIDAGVEAAPGMRVSADPVLLETALHCLIDNARKFSLEGPVWVRQAGAALAVSDCGFGFDMGYAERIFRPFERLVGEDFPGTGIGLAKVHRIAERHGGRVWAKSAVDRGATFFLDLDSGPGTVVLSNRNGLDTPSLRHFLLTGTIPEAKQ